MKLQHEVDELRREVYLQAAVDSQRFHQAIDREDLKNTFTKSNVKQPLLC